MRDRPSDPAPGTKDSGAADLSSEIVATIGHDADERVTCKRVSDNRYRCNWWVPESMAGYDNPMMRGLLVTTHRVRRSRFLHVTKTEAGLVIKDWSRGSGQHD
jgi:hypothetical protein